MNWWSRGSLLVLVGILAWALHGWRLAVLDTRRCTDALRYQARRDGITRAEQAPLPLRASRYRGEND